MAEDVSDRTFKLAPILNFYPRRAVFVQSLLGWLNSLIWESLNFSSHNQLFGQKLFFNVAD